MFWTKKTLDVKDYEAIQKEITDLHQKIERINAVMLRFDSDLMDMRTRIRRKMEVSPPTEVERGQVSDKPQVLNTFNPFSI